MSVRAGKIQRWALLRRDIQTEPAGGNVSGGESEDILAGSGLSAVMTD
jgi:hypothetical protein